MAQIDKHNPRLSVVIATYGRAETLRDVLRHLDDQELDASEYEVIVVSDRSPDNTPDVCRDMSARVRFELSFIENEQNRGPGFTQNRGIELARAPVILLMADDIMHSRGSLKTHLEFHTRHPEPEVAALGRVIQSPDVKHISVFLRYWNPFRFNELDGQSTLPAYRFGAANLSVKKQMLTERGMFREDLSHFGAAAMEDLELGYRLKKHGLRLHYLPDAWAHHFHVYTLDQAIRRWYERGLNFGEFRKAAPDPELTVYFHDLRWSTFREYAGVLQGANPFQGREKNLSWHLFREGVRRLVLNGVTEKFAWRPVLDLAERWPWLGDRMSAQIYRAYLYYHFIRGMQDGSKTSEQRQPSVRSVDSKAH